MTKLEVQAELNHIKELFKGETAKSSIITANYWELKAVKRSKSDKNYMEYKKDVRRKEAHRSHIKGDK